MTLSGLEVSFEMSDWGGSRGDGIWHRKEALHDRDDRPIVRSNMLATVWLNHHSIVQPSVLRDADAIGFQWSLQSRISKS